MKRIPVLKMPQFQVDAACRNSVKQLPLCTELLEQDELFGDQQALGTCDKAEQKPKQ